MPTSVEPRRHAWADAEADDVARARRAVWRADAGLDPERPRQERMIDWLRDFVRRYGWRAYALPLLVVVTIVALATTTSGKPAHKTAAPKPQARPPAVTPSAPQASGPIALKSDTAGAAKVDPNALKGAALPSGPAYTTKGAGTFRVLKGTTPVVGKGKLYRYDIEVENGVTGVNLTQFAELVDKTLADPRSWSGHGVSLQRVSGGHVDFHISLTSSLTVRQYCGYSIPVETSCYAPQGSVEVAKVNRVVFNVARWVRGSAAYIGDLNAYRQYMINHEDGHALGHEHAHECLSDGLAPAMMQQTFGLKSAATGKMCEANPWPYPPGATDAPGAEQPDTPQNDEYGLGD